MHRRQHRCHRLVQSMMTTTTVLYHGGGHGDGHRVVKFLNIVVPIYRMGMGFTAQDRKATTRHQLSTSTTIPSKICIHDPEHRIHLPENERGLVTGFLLKTLQTLRSKTDAFVPVRTHLLQVMTYLRIVRLTTRLATLFESVHTGVIQRRSPRLGYTQKESAHIRTIL